MVVFYANNCRDDQARFFISRSGTCMIMRSIHRDSGRGAHPSSDLLRLAGGGMN